MTYIKDYVEEVAVDMHVMYGVLLSDNVDIFDQLEAMLNDSGIINRCFVEGVPVEKCVDALLNRHVYKFTF